MIICLGVLLPTPSSSLPGRLTRRAASSRPAWPCSWWGLPGQRHYCRCRWSLTPPFHPHRATIAARQYTSLWHYSVGLPRPAVSRHHALWSADFPQPVARKPRPRSPGQLDTMIVALAGLPCKCVYTVFISQGQLANCCWPTTVPGSTCVRCAFCGEMLSKQLVTGTLHDVG
jgi:hypothetical protein